MASAALRQLGDRARASGTNWTLGVAARSRALVSQDQDAELLYSEVVARLG